MSATAVLDTLRRELARSDDMIGRLADLLASEPGNARVRSRLDWELGHREDIVRVLDEHTAEPRS